MHFHRLWNGMFGRHQAEITVMQFIGHSLPVHQFVTVPWDFNPVPYCQPSSPTPMEYATSASLEWHVWPGRRSIYNISPKMNVIARMEFKLAYYNSTVQRFNHYTTRTTSNNNSSTFLFTYPSHMTNIFNKKQQLEMV